MRWHDIRNNTITTIPIGIRLNFCWFFLFLVLKHQSNSLFVLVSLNFFDVFINIFFQKKFHGICKGSCVKGSFIVNPQLKFQMHTNKIKCGSQVASWLNTTTATNCGLNGSSFCVRSISFCNCYRRLHKI